MHLLVPAAGTLDLPERGLRLAVSGAYPYDGRVRIRVEGAPSASSAFALSLRIPGWCRKWSLAVDGARAAAKAEDGFVSVRREWKPGDEIALSLDMPVETVRAHAAVADDSGLVALQRGPLVYALESVDNGPGLHRLAINADQDFRLVQAKGLPRGTVAIRGSALERSRPGEALYSAARPKARRRTFTAIPYALWQNRGPAEMRVWIRENFR